MRRTDLKGREKAFLWTRSPKAAMFPPAPKQAALVATLMNHRPQRDFLLGISRSHLISPLGPETGQSVGR